MASGTVRPDLARKKIGVLIVIERVTGLEDVMETGTRLDAEINERGEEKKQYAENDEPDGGRAFYPVFSVI